MGHASNIYLSTQTKLNLPRRFCQRPSKNLGGCQVRLSQDFRAKVRLKALQHIAAFGTSRSLISSLEEGC